MSGTTSNGTVSESSGNAPPRVPYWRSRKLLRDLKGKPYNRVDADRIYDQAMAGAERAGLAVHTQPVDPPPQKLAVEELHALRQAGWREDCWRDTTKARKQVGLALNDREYSERCIKCAERRLAALREEEADWRKRLAEIFSLDAELEIALQINQARENGRRPETQSDEPPPAGDGGPIDSSADAADGESRQVLGLHRGVVTATKGGFVFGDTVAVFVATQLLPIAIQGAPDLLNSILRWLFSLAIATTIVFGADLWGRLRHKARRNGHREFLLQIAAAAFGVLVPSVAVSRAGELAEFAGSGWLGGIFFSIALAAFTVGTAVITAGWSWQREISDARRAAEAKRQEELAAQRAHEIALAKAQPRSPADVVADRLTALAANIKTQEDLIARHRQQIKLACDEEVQARVDIIERAEVTNEMNRKERSAAHATNQLYRAVRDAAAARRHNTRPAQFADDDEKWEPKMDDGRINTGRLCNPPRPAKITVPDDEPSEPAPRVQVPDLEYGPALLRKRASTNHHSTPASTMR